MGQDDAEARNAVLREQRRLVLDRRMIQYIEGLENTLRIRFEQGLAEEMDAMTRVCGLSESQQKKLRLAAQGDLLRTLRQLETSRGEYAQLPDPGDIQFQKDIQSFVSMAGCFGDESLFYKTLRGMLTDEQRRRYLVIENKRREAAVVRAVAIVEKDFKNVPLTDENRQQIIALLVKEGNPPATITPYSHFVVLLHAAKLKPALIRLMNDDQWQSFANWISKARAMEAVLRRSELIVESETEGALDSSNAEVVHVP